jgi:hypothetical protein
MVTMVPVLDTNVSPSGVLVMMHHVIQVRLHCVKTRIRLGSVGCCFVCGACCTVSRTLRALRRSFSGLSMSHRVIGGVLRTVHGFH